MSSRYPKPLRKYPVKSRPIILYERMFALEEGPNWVRLVRWWV